MISANRNDPKQYDDSFTTDGDKIWLTAIRPVAEGDHLSIDYGNNFYMPTAGRRAEIEDTYEVKNYPFFFFP